MTEGSKLPGFWAWAHKGNVKTHALHFAQAAGLMMPAGFAVAGIALWATGWIAPLTGLGMLIGGVIVVSVFTHRELGDIARALFGVLYPGERYEGRVTAGKLFFDKLLDGFGDWWAPFLAIPLWALILSYLGG